MTSALTVRLPSTTQVALTPQIQWLAPSPLWQELSSAADTSDFRSPSILRFATDTFMQDLHSVLANAPQTLRNYVAQPETWRSPGAGIDYTAPAPAPTFKLFQPTHLRYYLVTAALICRKPGLPDHTLDTSAGESVAFVVRQLRPKPGYTNADCAVYDASKCTEYAWIPVTGGASASTTTAILATASATTSPAPQPGWIQASGAARMPGEELIPLSLTHVGSNGNSRRIFLGLIPASRRQQYVGAQTLSSSSTGNGTSTNGSSASGTAPDPRMDMLYRQIIAPWCNLLDWWKSIDSTTTSSSVAVENQTSSTLASALILYDFGTFLAQNIPNLWGAISGTASVASLSSAETTLYNTLGFGLRGALANAYQYGAQFEAMGPDNVLPSGYTPYTLTDTANWITATSLQTPVANALPPLGSSVPALPPIPQKPANALGDYYFIVRCVYVRPQCSCNVTSSPCRPFLLSNYFDPDAPARRIQVALPVDTSAASLRKYDKGIAFMISDELRNQMSRVASLSDLASGSIGGAGGVTVGWICSYSIPIITICALILLFVIVIALNLVFFWLPFFKICFPVPQLKGKS
jgi:hypothetical protein